MVSRVDDGSRGDREDVIQDIERLRGRLFTWLEERPPTTLTTLADRLLVASVLARVLRVHGDGPKAVKRSSTGPSTGSSIGLRSIWHDLIVPGRALAAHHFDDVVAAAWSPEGAQHLTTLCVLCAVFEGFGHDTSQLRLGIAQHKRLTPAPKQEPWRSVAAYWLWRAGLSRGFAVDGAIPEEPRLAFAFHAHRVFFAAHYGKNRCCAPGVGPGVGQIDGAVEATVDVVEAFGAAVALDNEVAAVTDDADCTAQLLLATACQHPLPPTVALLHRLAGSQRPDGSLSTAIDDDSARHHAACVAVLALTLVHTAAVG